MNDEQKIVEIHNTLLELEVKGKDCYKVIKCLELLKSILNKEEGNGRME